VPGGWPASTSSTDTTLRQALYVFCENDCATADQVTLRCYTTEIG
jgi:hypothetical protein